MAGSPLGTTFTDTDAATNDVATATKAAAGEARRHFITHVSASFSAAAIASLELRHGSTVIHKWNVHNSLVVNFDHPIELPPNVAANAVLAAGGATIVGNVNLSGFTI